ncbi:MAG: nuclear transport factor 2 family protein [Novosphingobium sp.]|nr:nuclear transport factor 2 family protein [Novosphingobium sp.]
MADLTAESLIAAEQARREAIVALDFDALEAMTADWFHYAHISGLVETREEYFARMRGSSVYPSIVATHSWDLEVELRKGYALMTGKSHIDVVTMKFDSLFLAVWEPDDAGWLISAYASTPLPDD